MANKEFLIGIAAPTCAGKTTLLDSLRDRLSEEVTVVNFDDYDRYYPGSTALAREMENSTIVNWEDPQLFDWQRYVRDMHRLKGGMSIVLNPYSRENHEGSAGVRRLSPTAFTIVEGIFTLAYPAARTLFDMKYYLDIPEDVMIERRLARSVGSTNPCDQPEYITGPMVEGTRQYVVPQKQYADKVLDGMLPTQELVEHVLFDFRTLQQ